ncbi:MAG: efflux RND transporter periplasmic adaptor subunit [Candidatus Glassbacteria bacterium]|nr:efflux RND transporter periplasmic adaptor subunit [Candidatus Glassbacteria bacterium]
MNGSVYPPCPQEGPRAGKIFGPALVLLLILAGASACSKGKAEDTGKEADNRPQRLTNVEVQTARPTELEEYILLTGYTEAAHDIIISSEQGGTVQELLVDRGDRVAGGQVLARVSADIYQAQLVEAEAGLRLKQATLKKAKTLYERGSLTAMQRLQAQVEHDAAEANVELAESRLERAVVAAPFSGVIDDRFVEQGEMVSPGGRLLRLVDRSRMKAVSEFSELDVTNLHQGIPAEVSFDALPGSSFQAELSFIAASADMASRSFPCEFQLANPDRTIRGGMIARIRVLKERHTGVLVLPQTALVETENGRSLFVLESETAVRKAVTLGASNNEMVIVKSGLRPGESVIVTGHRDLVDGQQVRVTGRKD